jgi:4'-phosphopantetheinyl transferase
VWLARTGDAEPDLWQLLDGDELNRRATLRRPADRDRFLVGVAVTRLALARYLRRPPTTIPISRACPRCGRPHGKPRLMPGVHPRIEWSISHAGDRVVVAMALEIPLGVDVEVSTRALPVDQLARMVLSDQEIGMLKRLADKERARGFLRFWTRKEAILKASGQGLALPLRSLTVSGPDDAPRLVSWSGSRPLGQLALQDLDVGSGYLASLASVGKSLGLVILDGAALLRRH